MEGLRELCTRHGSVLIFDEVITGFRVGLGGAQKEFGITPDLSIFGKAMASGYPIAVICGKRNLDDGRPLMQLVADGKVIHAGTMNSNNPCVAAALETLRVLEDENVHPRLYELGQKLMHGLRDGAEKAGQPLLVQGLGPMLHTGFTPRQRSARLPRIAFLRQGKARRIHRKMHEEGIRIIGRGLWYLSAAHTASDIERAIETAARVLATLPKEVEGRDEAARDIPAQGGSGSG